MIDIHNHSTHSQDGHEKIEDMILNAIKLGIEHFGLSEHLDYEYEEYGMRVKATNVQKYFDEISPLKNKYKNELNVLIGIEFGHGKEASIINRYNDLAKKYEFDFIINSVHVTHKKDCYFPEYFIDKDMKTAYNLYFDELIDSFELNLDYDIVGHIGYVSRNAPYFDNKIIYADFAQSFDKILSLIIKNEKCLEINTNVRGSKSNFIPDTDILTRYYELGGRKITFGSDAHTLNRMGENYQLVCKTVKLIGFTDLFYYEKRQEKKHLI